MPASDDHGRVPAAVQDARSSTTTPTGKVVERSAAELAELVRRLRVTPWVFAVGVAAAVLVVALVVWTSRLPQDISRSARFSWWWALAAVVPVLLVWVGDAVSLSAAAGWRPPWWRTVQLELAEAVTLVVTPMSSGSLTLSMRYLERIGMDSSSAAGASGLSTFVTSVVSALTLPVAAAVAAGTLDTQSLEQEVPSGFWEVLLAVVALAAVVTLVVRAPTLRRSARRWAVQAGHYVRRVVASPTTGLAVAAGELVAVAGQVACAALLLRAVGAPVHLAALVVVTQLAGAASNVVPVPGGLGAPDAILIAGVTSTGVPHGSAVVAALLYRMVTYWLPMVPGVAALYDLFRRDYV
ncbi:MAG: YbhN family protein [Actinomycetes bacterium]